jgi:hypothetical protein
MNHPPQMFFVFRVSAVRNAILILPDHVIVQDPAQRLQGD